MTITMGKSKSEGISLLVLAISALLFTGFLFYIDEGYYNFQWMADPISWILFTVYTLVVFISQLIFFVGIPRKYNGVIKTIFCIIAGPGLGILLITLLATIL